VITKNKVQDMKQSLLFYYACFLLLYCPLVSYPQTGGGSLEATRDVVARYTDALNALTNPRLTSTELQNHIGSMVTSLFTDSATLYNFLPFRTAKDYIDPRDFLNAYHNNYKSFRDVNTAITILKGEVNYAVPGHQYMQSYGVHVIRYKENPTGKPVVDSIPIHLWVASGNGGSRIMGTSMQPCKNWPFIPRPESVTNSFDCANNQIAFEWKLPYELCSDSTLFEIHLSTNNQHYSLLSKTQAKSFRYTPGEGGMLYFKIRTHAQGRRSPFSEVIKTQANSSPAGLYAKESVIRKRVILKWDSTANVTYNIYRKETSPRATSDVKLGTVSTNTFHDKDCKDGKFYEYSVTSICPDGKESVPSRVEIATVPPVKLTITRGRGRNESITLKWDKPDTHEPLFYNVYRAVMKRNRFKKLADHIKFTDTTYVDYDAPLGSNIYYKIRIGNDTSRFERDFSNVKTVPFTFKGLYFGFSFKPIRSRIKNDLFDKDALAKLGNNTYQSFSFDAVYYIHDLVGVGAGLGMSSYNREKSHETAVDDFSYKMVYLDLPIQVMTPVIKPFNYKNQIIFNPLITAGIDFSMQLSKESSSNIEWYNEKSYCVSAFGAAGIGFFATRSIQVNISRVYTQGLIDIGGVKELKTGKAYDISKPVSHGFTIQVVYKFL